MFSVLCWYAAHKRYKIHTVYGPRPTYYKIVPVVIIKMPVIADISDLQVWLFHSTLKIQESPAIADKPARRESMPKIAPIRRAYNVVADNTGQSSCV